MVRLHDFELDITGVELPQQFTFPFHYTPHPLCRMAAKQVQQYIASHNEWASELSKGKMLGVLVVQSHENEQPQFLAAFSGNLAGSNDHPYFVPAVYDLLAPNGEFKQGEATITAINHRIATLSQAPSLIKAREQLAIATRQGKIEVEQFKQLMAASKAQRDAVRATGNISPLDDEKMLNESRFQKAELRRIKQRIDITLAQHRDSVALLEEEITQLKAQRKAMSEALQERIFRLFIVENANGITSDLTNIFKQAEGKLPPAGSGECCAPKLLHYAYTHHYKPLCMAEFWCGASPTGEVRHHGHFYPACRSKCKPILDFMLKGLDVESNALAQSLIKHDIEIIYDDPWLAVINKPSGMLSVPGKLLEDSALTRFQQLCPNATGPMVVHRLDQETSGLLIFAKDKDTHKELQRQFALHEIHKCYIAVLQGAVNDNNGVIDLPLRPDIDDRPRQMVDYINGKPAITHYRVIKRNATTTLVEFSPVTGRTHQLRVHASHPQGLNCPIVGDPLYGTTSDKSRLMLHAASITFTHPTLGKPLTLTTPVEW